MDYFLDAYNKYAEFSGRASRKQYWMFVLVYVCISVVLSIVDAILNMSLLTTVFALGSLIPVIALNARRLHDSGKSGWWQLVALIPGIGTIIMAILACLDSDGDNEYGISPKAS